VHRALGVINNLQLSLVSHPSTRDFEPHLVDSFHSLTPEVSQRSYADEMFGAKAGSKSSRRFSGLYAARNLRVWRL
jgi:hypothetical protein